MLTLLLLACAPADIKLGPDDTARPDDTAPDSTDTTESGDSGETGHSGETGETAETGETGETGVVGIDDFQLVVDEDVVTMLHATWTDPGAEESWVEYRFDGGDWLVAPTIGVGAATVLGIPAETEVEARAAARTGEAVARSNTVRTTTGSLPAELLEPHIVAWDPTLADDSPWILVSLSVGGYTFDTPYYLELFDREGRVVWYKRVDGDMFSFYPTVAFDGTHIWWDAADPFGVGREDPGVTRQTLDGRWSVSLEAPEMGQAVAEGPDGSFFFERRGRASNSLDRLDRDGAVTTVWDCRAWMRELGENASACYLNTCNWSERTGTVLASGFISNTVFEVDVESGEVVRQMGQLEEGSPYDFSPAESMFDYQHDPRWLDNGHLLVSTHQRGRSGVQFASEYSVDDETQTLTRVWTYVSTDRWATQMGEATRLPNGNTAQGYGQDGAIREVTPAGEVAWEVEWEKDDYGYRVLGHANFIDDIYAINRGPEGR